MKGETKEEETFLNREAEKVEGVVLKYIPFKERDRIVSLLTPDRGLLSLYVKEVSKTNPFLINLTSPLCRGEFVFKKGRSDLCSFTDGAILDLHIPIRSSFLSLHYSGKMIQGIVKTQASGKNAQRIYRLFLAYLKQLPQSMHPETLWASFELKLLKDEGLLAIEPFCVVCQSEKAASITLGESRCRRCAHQGAALFSELEWSQITLLLEARRFDLLPKTKLSSHLIEGVSSIFNTQLEVK